jgi:hypothetical protein
MSAMVSMNSTRRYSQDVVRVGLVVFGHVSLVLAGVRRSPRSSLMRVETPTDPVVFTSVLLARDVSVDLVHGFDDHTDVVGFGHGGEGGSDGGSITGEHGSGTGTVDIVSGVTNGTDPWQVGRSATTKDGVLDLLPESSLVQELMKQIR